jgi:hypothetical protein
MVYFDFWMLLIFMVPQIDLQRLDDYAGNLTPKGCHRSLIINSVDKKKQLLNIY